MDRPIPKDEVFRRRRTAALRIIIAVAAAAGLYLLLAAWIRPGVSRRDIRTAAVGRGTIEGSFSAAGTVAPRYEQSITSPAMTRLIAVRRRPGNAVRKGEPILDLDKSELALALDRTERELALAANRQRQLTIDMNRTIADLRGQLAIKDLRVAYLRSKTEQGGKMFALGAISKDQLDQEQLEERIALIERSELDSSIRTTSGSLENQLAGVSTEVRTLRREEEEGRRRLDLLGCHADRDGIVTWIRDDIGGAVREGDVVARVADLSGYRVDASVSDIHAASLRPGMPARVRLGDLLLAGTVAGVYPTVENGTTKFSVDLADSANPRLRPNLAVDVDLVTGRRENALKVKKGPFADGRTDAFVIRGTTAVRTPVRTGIASFDEIEILSGLAEGDEVILSDMSAYEHSASITIR